MDQPAPALGASGLEVVEQASAPKKTTPASSFTLPPEDVQAGPTGHSSMAKSSATSSGPAFPGAFNLPPEPDDVDFDNPLAGSDVSSEPSERSDSDEGEILSDTLERPDQTEEMNYRETVRSVRSFMGWTHIRTLRVI